MLLPRALIFPAILSILFVSSYLSSQFLGRILLGLHPQLAGCSDLLIDPLTQNTQSTTGLDWPIL